MVAKTLLKTLMTIMMESAIRPTFAQQAPWVGFHHLLTIMIPTGVLIQPKIQMMTMTVFKTHLMIAPRANSIGPLPQLLITTPMVVLTLTRKTIMTIMMKFSMVMMIVRPAILAGFPTHLRQITTPTVVKTLQLKTLMMITTELLT